MSRIKLSIIEHAEGSPHCSKREEMYEVRQVLSATTAGRCSPVVRRQRCHPWVTLLSLCPRSSRADSGKPSCWADSLLQLKDLVRLVLLIDAFGWSQSLAPGVSQLVKSG